jgi:hypothetical protein
MAPSLREFCLLAKSRPIDALQSERRATSGISYVFLEGAKWRKQ